MIRETLIACRSLLVFVALTGVAYPLVMTAVSQALFPHRANGSLIERNGKVIGSELIGQPFDDPKYFWSRPSATSPYPYNAGSSTGSNLAVGNPAQLDVIAARIKKLCDADPGNSAPVPQDLVTVSGSGLDPHISVAAAEYQVSRVAKARGLTAEAVRRMVRDHTASRQFGILGEPCVNVLELNLALDGFVKSTATQSWKDPM